MVKHLEYVKFVINLKLYFADIKINYTFATCFSWY